ncbi:MAG: hypothetical protein ACFE9S_09275 [Candidatus Hermodarchaeota archaeon]
MQRDEVWVRIPQSIKNYKLRLPYRFNFLMEEPHRRINVLILQCMEIIRLPTKPVEKFHLPSINEASISILTYNFLTIYH